jgi:hypothetical protein
MPMLGFLFIGLLVISAIFFAVKVFPVKAFKLIDFLTRIFTWITDRKEINIEEGELYFTSKNRVGEVRRNNFVNFPLIETCHRISLDKMKISFFLEKYSADISVLIKVIDVDKDIIEFAKCYGIENINSAQFLNTHYAPKLIESLKTQLSGSTNSIEDQDKWIESFKETELEGHFIVGLKIDKR